MQTIEQLFREVIQELNINTKPAFEMAAEPDDSFDLLDNMADEDFNYIYESER